MTHNEYTNKYKSEIDRWNRRLREYFGRYFKEEALREEFMSRYEGRELSDSYVTENGELVL